jgi:hypothetical protein
VIRPFFSQNRHAPTETPNMAHASWRSTIPGGGKGPSSTTGSSARSRSTSAGSGRFKPATSSPISSRAAASYASAASTSLRKRPRLRYLPSMLIAADHLRPLSVRVTPLKRELQALPFLASDFFLARATCSRVRTNRFSRRQSSRSPLR